MDGMTAETMRMTITGRAATSHEALADAACIRRVQRGETAAFNELIERYQGMVYRQAYWLLGDESAAEDAAQEAFFRAFQKLHTFNGPSFRNWIMRIASNYCLDLLRMRKRHPQLSLTPAESGDEPEDSSDRWLHDPSPSPQAEAERHELRSVLNQCLMSLDPHDRMPILLVDLQELDYQQAAELMGLRMGTFKSRLVRARAKLVALVQRASGEAYPLAV